jgi:putative protein-disulfide isomerase
MSTTTLHYIYDPLCGWCYGAAPLVKAAREIVAVCAHGGGMMTGARRQAVTAQLRNYVMQHDSQIAALTAQHFGEAYFDGLLRDATAVFDSEPPTAAMLAAEQLAGRGLDMIARLQVAHYVEGRRVADRAVLIEEAEAIGLDSAAFAAALDRQTGEVVQAHIRETRQFMSVVGASGFPTFVLETNGCKRLIEVTRYLGHPQDLRDWLRTNCLSPKASPAVR